MEKLKTRCIYMLAFMLIQGCGGSNQGTSGIESSEIESSKFNGIEPIDLSDKIKAIKAEIALSKNPPINHLKRAIEGQQIHCSNPEIFELAKIRFVVRNEFANYLNSLKVKKSLSYDEVNNERKKLYFKKAGSKANKYAYDNFTLYNCYYFYDRYHADYPQVFENSIE